MVVHVFRDRTALPAGLGIREAEVDAEQDACQHDLLRQEARVRAFLLDCGWRIAGDREADACRAY
jgi:hypothetical protein